MGIFGPSESENDKCVRLTLENRRLEVENGKLRADLEAIHSGLANFGSSRVAAHAQALNEARAKITADSVLAQQQSNINKAKGSLAVALATIEEITDIAASALSDAGHVATANMVQKLVNARTKTLRFTLDPRAASGDGQHGS